MLEDDSNNSYESHRDDDEDEEEIPWITWFCSLKGNEFFCEVDEEYVQDEFNLTGLSTMVPFYDHAMDIILDLETPGEDDLTDEQQHMVEAAAETLYGLIHARFMTTTRGLKLMEEKYREVAFGRCPRVLCGGQPVLPVGQSDVVRESSVKVFCPKCQDVYYPRSSRHKSLDGAFWGTTFPHLFLLTLPENKPKQSSRTGQTYVPKIFGFRVRQPQQQQQQVHHPQGGRAEGDGAAGQAADSTAVMQAWRADGSNPNAGRPQGSQQLGPGGGTSQRPHSAAVPPSFGLP